MASRIWAPAEQLELRTNLAGGEEGSPWMDDEGVPRRWPQPTGACRLDLQPLERRRGRGSPAADLRERVEVGGSEEIWGRRMQCSRHGIVSAADERGGRDDRRRKRL